MPEMDFGFDGNHSSVEDAVDVKTEDNVTDIETGKKVTGNGEDITDVTNNEVQDSSKEIKEDDKDKSDSTDEQTLEVGTIIEFEDKKYTVSDNGDIIDADGNVFKEAKDANAWLKSLETEESEDNPTDIVDIKAIQKVLGVEIQDEDGKPIEFENSAEGVASYVRAYVENSQRAIADATIDALYSKYPILEDVINYYVANGNSLDGFNELKDRSTIELDINNEAQCEAIIREAWKEDNRRGNVDNYIQYLKSQNLLGATAEEELNAMAERDKANKTKLAQEAEAKEKEYIESQKQYWGDINKRINTDKKIGKYQIPDTIIRVKDGQRISATPQDFFNYIYQVDKNGYSQYQHDLAKEAQERPESRIADDLIAAYLKFTGGSYESLVNMAINEKQVKTIKIKSKTAPKRKATVTPPKKDKDKPIDFGY